VRIAAGILLIIGAVVTGGLTGVAYGTLSVFHMWRDPLPFMLNPVFVFVAGMIVCGVVLAGGILTVKRKQWGFCLASSIVGWAILPVVFICLRKKEWQETSDSVGREVSKDDQEPLLPRRGSG
jgi:hypothetical protein